ncbi:MAG: hypothetical protein Q9N62_12465 [Ghiorsea sp.]|nr:hypothetical protein [Ghiorsea sp.]
MLIVKKYTKEIIGHLSKDSTAIHAREKPAKKEAKAKPSTQKAWSSEERGRTP